MCVSLSAPRRARTSVSTNKDRSGGRGAASSYDGRGTGVVAAASPLHVSVARLRQRMASSTSTFSIFRRMQHKPVLESRCRRRIRPRFLATTTIRQFCLSLVRRPSEHILAYQSVFSLLRAEMAIGWVHPWVGSGRVGSKFLTIVAS